MWSCEPTLDASAVQRHLYNQKIDVGLFCGLQGSTIVIARDYDVNQMSVGLGSKPAHRNHYQVLHAYTV